MPYASNQGVNIYYEVEGHGLPLVLAHGMGAGADLNAWRNTGYTDVLKDEFQLILFDIRGFGKSDKPGKVDIPLSDAADDVITVLDYLGIEKAHYLGYSMGASVGFKQAVNHIDRFYSFILGGMTPGPWPEEMVRAREISAELVKLRQSDPEAYFARMEGLLGHPLTSGEKSELLSRDEETGAAEQPSRSDEIALKEVELAGIDIPCLLYCGDRDPFYKGAQESVQYMPRAVFVSLDGLDHISAFFRSDVIVRLVKQFLTVVNRGLPSES
ncbi:alpha/beta fold hydrolase [Chloroflexota bacterium]